MSVLTKSLPFPAYFCAHGGGPMPLLNDPSMDHSKLLKSWANSIRAITSVCGKPKAIVVVSAHYQTQVPSVGSDPAPKMLYDYGGFPKESYSIQYPAPGSPEVSRRALELLANAGIPAKEDKTRPYDHGVFVPLIKMFPDATIPVVPVSILHSEDPKHHIAMGRALAPLRSEGVLIIGSGLTVHNFHSRGGDGSTFNNKLIEVITSEGLSKEERISALSNFLKWPRAEEAQTAASGTDHFMPLLTAYGSGIDATEDGRGKVAGRLTLSLRERSFDFLELWFGEEAVLSQLKSFEA